MCPPRLPGYVGSCIWSALTITETSSFKLDDDCFHIHSAGWSGAWKSDDQMPCCRPEPAVCTVLSWNAGRCCGLRPCSALAATRTGGAAVYPHSSRALSRCLLFAPTSAGLCAARPSGCQSFQDRLMLLCSSMAPWACFGCIMGTALHTCLVISAVLHEYSASAGGRSERGSRDVQHIL